MLQTVNLSLGLDAVFLEGRLQLLVMSGFCQLGQSGEDLLFREIDVLQRVVKQVIKPL